MKVALICASPKLKNSASGALLNDMKGYLAEKGEIIEIGLHQTSVSKEAAKRLCDADAWVFAYPLYVDGIPAHLLSCLVQLQEVCKEQSQIHVYGIVNCGFYEGVQADLALEILRNWCAKSGLVWGGGVGVGGGGSLGMMPQIQKGEGPKAPIDDALQVLADNVVEKKTTSDVYVSVAFPRTLYKMGAQMGWRQMIRANGGKARDLGDRPQ